VLWIDLFSQWNHDPHDLDRTIQLEQQSISLDNDNASAYAMMSRLYLYKKQYDLGIAAAERAIALVPNHVGGYVSLAGALAVSGKPAEAVEVA